MQIIVRAFWSLAAVILGLTICASGSGGRALAADKKGAVSATADARATIYRHVELRQDGSVNSPALDQYGLAQLNRRECDPELYRVETECVLLLYEIQ
tara:strand:+ start:2235 stop:2528 length:294 start_codon:yes stop_codon:yes gene_type:complete